MERCCNTQFHFNPALDAVFVQQHGQCSMEEEEQLIYQILASPLYHKGIKLFIDRHQADPRIHHQANYPVSLSALLNSLSDQIRGNQCAIYTSDYEEDNIMTLVTMLSQRAQLNLQVFSNPADAMQWLDIDTEQGLALLLPHPVDSIQCVPVQPTEKAAL